MPLFLSILLTSVSLASYRTVADGTRVEVLENIANNQEILANGYTDFGQTEQGLSKPAALSSNSTQIGVLENLTHIQEISAIGDIGIKQTALLPDNAQLDVQENVTHIQEISAIGDIGIKQTALLPDNAQLDVQENVTHIQEISAIGDIGIKQTALLPDNAQLDVQENVTHIQEISAIGDIGIKQTALLPDNAQLDVQENVTHIQEISAIGDIGIKQTALLPDNAQLDVQENVTHIQASSAIEDTGSGQVEENLQKPTEILFTNVAKKAEHSVSKLLPSQPLEGHHLLLKELFKTANNVKNKTTQTEGPQMVLEIDQSGLLNQLLDKTNTELVELGAVESKPKVPDAEMSIIPIFSSMLCQACKDIGDIECMKIHCSAGDTQKTVLPNLDIRDGNNAGMLLV